MSEENDDPRVKTLHVKVDSSEMKKLVETTSEQQKKIKELESQVEDAETAKELLDDLKEKAAVELESLGIPTEVEDLRTKEDLDRAIATIQKLRAKGESHGDSHGSAPLNSAQYGTSQKEGQVETTNQLIDLLNDRCSADNKNLADKKLAVQQREILLAKNFKGQVEAHKPFNYTSEDTLGFLKEKHKRRKALSSRGES